MAKRECPRCGSERATTVMLPSTSGTKASRPHPAFRCMVCDTQWTDSPVVSSRARGTTEDDSEQPPSPTGD